MTTISAREFNRDVSAAKRQARKSPVVITDRGKPAFALLSYQDYQKLTGEPGTIVDRLSMDDDLNISFEPVHLSLEVPHL